MRDKNGGKFTMRVDLRLAGGARSKGKTVTRIFLDLLKKFDFL